LFVLSIKQRMFLICKSTTGNKLTSKTYGYDLEYCLFKKLKISQKQLQLQANKPKRKKLI
jgi:hypothetical protein